MNWTKEHLTKWILIAAVLAAGGALVVPWLLKLAFDLLTLAILGVVGLALWFTLPALCEFLASAGWRLWEQAIRQDPITKMKREFLAYGQQIDGIDRDTASAMARRDQLVGAVQEAKESLSPEDVGQYKADLASIDQMIQEMVQIRAGELTKYRKFERDIKRAEAQYAIGHAFKQALGSFRLVSRGAPTSFGTQVAFDEVQRQLTESRANLSLILGRQREALPEPRKEVKA